MRTLASIKKIQEVRNIPESDNLEHYRVDGWWVVDTIGKYAVGDLVTYMEIDSWISHDLVPFLSKGKEPREYNGVKGERLRTVKLRGAISQGLLLPISIVLDRLSEQSPYWDVSKISSIFEDMDVTEILGVQKWERPEEPQLAGNARGLFPSRFQKTDETRIQSCMRAVEHQIELYGDQWQVEEKLEGSSMTIGMVGDEIHVCSRNLSLKLDESNEGNSFVKAAKATGLLETLPRICAYYNVELAFQGELIGEGIQGNIYKLKGHQWRIFNIFDVTNQQKVLPQTRNTMIVEINDLFDLQLQFSPIVGYGDNIGSLSVAQILELADGDSALLVGRQREGLVFKHMVNPDFSFKAISDKYLLKQKD